MTRPENVPSNLRRLVRDALAALGIEQFVIAVHDASFPSFADEDTGRGTPYSRGARDFLSFVSELGFDGVQFGPQGETSLANPSPYDGTVFSKGLLSLALADLASSRYGHLIHEDELRHVVERARALPPDARYAAAYRAHHELVALAAERLAERSRPGPFDPPFERSLSERIASFVEASRNWLAHDAHFQALVARYGTDDWRSWPSPNPELTAEDRSVVRAWQFGQFVLAEQHEALRAHVASMDLALYGDLQIGLSFCDTWSRSSLFLEGYAMGAPPSRTNPEGQPWGYAMFDPRKFMARFVADTDAGPASASPLSFFHARLDKVLAEFDGLRIDHPHGLVCPWVYAKNEDPTAVRRGARLFGSPDDPAHPSLAAFAIARPDQIDRRALPYADDRVRFLDDAQIETYSIFFDAIAAALTEHGRAQDAILCEVLSTCPLPLRLVMERAGVGRFRVTQKAKMDDPEDVYRSENAKPRDWIMIGNHDTPPLLAVVERWARNGDLRARADYLAERLEADISRRSRFADALVASPAAFVRAMFAELFASPAKHVMVFFADLFGSREIYNTPGVVRAENWQLRIPTNFRDVYSEALAKGDAFDVPGALALAMRARGASFVRAHEDLVAQLERHSTGIRSA